MNTAPFIVICGANNLGKTTQVNLLVDRLLGQGRQAIRTKYPIYGEVPSGPVIYNILRNPKLIRPSGDFSPQELQEYAALNRREYQPQLVSLLDRGVIVIAEDYTITGIAHGLNEGLERKFLNEINSGLRLPDLGILIEGERLVHANEKHRTETASQEPWEKVVQIHRDLAKEFGYITIRNEGSISEINNRLWDHIKPFIDSFSS